MLWPKFESEKVALNLAFTGTIKEEIIDKEEVAFYLVKYLVKNHLGKLCEKYKLQEEEIKSLIENSEDENEWTLEIIEMIGKSRGALASGGKIDMKKTSNLILQDFREGRTRQNHTRNCKSLNLSVENYLKEVRNYGRETSK